MTTTSPLTIGFIGAGDVAQTLARAAVMAGHSVVLSNSRGPETLTGLVGELGANASASTPAQATRADLVILAVGWDQVAGAVSDLSAWTGQIVVDTTNQWHNHDPHQPADLGDETGSEHIAAQLPGARVVKAFNTVYMRGLGESVGRTEHRLVIFLAGDDADAKTTVSAFIASLGLEPIDLGSLRDGGALTQAGGPLVALHLTTA